VQRAIVVDALDKVGRNCNRLGMQLFVHVALGTNRADPLEIAGPRPEREPVEHVDNAVLLGFCADHDRSLDYIVRTRPPADSHYV
jgi:hypothetical protein